MFKYILYSILIISACCFTNTLTAQSAPGLLGKKFTVAYDFNPYFNWSLPDLVGYESDAMSVFKNSIIYKHTFGADYILSRTLSVGVDFGLSGNQRLDDAEIFNSYFVHRLKSSEIGLRLKYFPVKKNGGIAPIGPYLQFRVLRLGYKSEMELIAAEPNGLTEPYIFSFEKGTVYTGSFGYGRQGILFGNIIYNVGCEMALVFSESAFTIGRGEAQTNLRNALLIGNLFKIKMGIAVPIF